MLTFTFFIAALSFVGVVQLLLSARDWLRQHNRLKDDLEASQHRIREIEGLLFVLQTESGEEVGVPCVVKGGPYDGHASIVRASLTKPVQFHRIGALAKAAQNYPRRITNPQPSATATD